MKPKLLFVTNGINGSGGLERVLAIKTKMLVENYNYEVHILVLNQNNTALFYEFSDKIVHHSITISGNLFLFYYRYFLKMKKIIKRIEPDIISVCDDGLKGLLFPVFFNFKQPIIYERHSSFNITKKKNVFNNFMLLIKKQIAKLGAKKFERFVVLTKNNLKEWNNLQNMVVIPNPLPFYPKSQSLLTNKKVIAVGSHSYNKGYDRLLMIWKEIAKLHQDWILEIYGKFDSNINLLELIDKYNLNNSVKLFKPVKNIYEKYLDASIMAMTSRSEGFGMVLIEAMSCGLPCIAFDCPSGPKDIINNDIDGYLIENNNIYEFAERLNFLIENYSKRKQFGLNARINVKRYMPENILKEWDTIYKEVLKK